MRKYFNIILILVLLLSSSGCALVRNPFKSWDKASTKVETVAQKINANQDKITDQAKNYIYATKLTLDTDPSTNRYHELESIFTDKALLTLGQPSMEDAVALRLMVNNLLSTNQALVEKGNKVAAKYNARIVDLQDESLALQGKLTQANKKLEEVGTANAGLAQKWSNVVKIFWWIVYGFIFVAVIRIVSLVLPPPYNSIGYIVGLPFSLLAQIIHKLIPEAQTACGLVSKEYKSLSSDLVNGIQNLKNENPSLHTSISNTISSSVNDSSITALNTIKTENKLAS